MKRAVVAICLAFCLGANCRQIPNPDLDACNAHCSKWGNDGYVGQDGTCYCRVPVEQMEGMMPEGKH